MSDQTNLAEATYNEIILLNVLEIFHKNKKKNTFAQELAY